MRKKIAKMVIGSSTEYYSWGAPRTCQQTGEYPPRIILPPVMVNTYWFLDFSNAATRFSIALKPPKAA